MIKVKIQKKSGFTLVEALVAISILTVAIAGPMYLATESIKDALAAKNRVIAFYLAQEAVEYVRNVRNSNLLNKIGGGSPSWLGSFTGGGNFYVDVVDNNPDSPDSKLYLNSNGNYTHVAGDETIFTRNVNVAVSGNEATVTSTVNWPERAGGGSQSVTVTQSIFNLAP